MAPLGPPPDLPTLPASSYVLCKGPGATCGPLPDTTIALARSTSGYGRVDRRARLARAKANLNL